MANRFRRTALNRQVQLVFNTTDGQKAVSDSKTLRLATLMQKVPYYTTMAGCHAVVEAIAALKVGRRSGRCRGILGSEVPRRTGNIIPPFP
jgi:hypothetical protein